LQQQEQIDRSLKIPASSDSTDLDILLASVLVVYEDKDAVITVAEDIGSVITVADNIESLGNSAENVVAAAASAAAASDSADAAASSASAASSSASSAASSASEASGYADSAEVSADVAACPSMVAYFARSTAPAGWLKANGAAVSRTAYSELFAAIGTTFGVGDGSTTFNLPDLRGVFPRGWDDGRGLDSGRPFGSYQADAFASHRHLVPNLTKLLANRAGTTGTGNKNDGGINTEYTNYQGGTETRPKNVALLACIRY
jgi:microcystin-dependent protein